MLRIYIYVDFHLGTLENVLENDINAKNIGMQYLTPDDRDTATDFVKNATAAINGVRAEFEEYDVIFRQKGSHFFHRRGAGEVVAGWSGVCR